MNEHPFRKMHLSDEKKEIVISVKLNKEDYQELQEMKAILQQPKDSTAIKQLIELGAKVVQDDKIKQYLSIIYGNRRRNKRLGIVDFE